MACKAVEDGRIHFVSEQYRKIFFHWLDNLRDWNISRQIVWGIPIPAWFKGDEIHIGEHSPDESWVQDPDTFDTWFSSGQWPFATLGYPDSLDFKTYYPTSVMETGYDILFFWVMRMIMLGLYRTGEVPFKDVYLHGLVRDAQRQKMSKSKGNVINPLDVAQMYGTDALRMALLVGNTPGQDMALAEDKIKAYKLFANKVWNIARFVLSQEKEGDIKTELKEEFDALAKEVTADIENYRVYMAAEKLYHYLWGRFAAEILEESKGKPEYGKTLYYILENSLKLLHPFMPFITEEIWASMPNQKGLLMVEEWPVKKAI
jgi:valyl-tRNA synthetase